MCFFIFIFYYFFLCVSSRFVAVKYAFFNSILFDERVDLVVAFGRSKLKNSQIVFKSPEKNNIKIKKECVFLRKISLVLA